MQVMGFFYAFGAAILFLVVPAFILLGRWREMKPGARRGILVIYLILVAVTVVLVLGVRHWLHAGL